jgi:hypothetical protein
MAITVKKFKVSNDMLSIDVDIEVGSGQLVTELLLWTESTYKDPSNSVDLSSLLTGTTNTETFTIAASDAGLSSFSGMYFGQITSNDPLTTIVATAALTQYYNAQATLLANISLSCLNCNDNFNNALLLDLYITAMKESLIVGRFQDAIGYQSKIQILTSDANCDTCSELSPVVSSAGNIVSVGVIDCILTT